MSTVAAAPSTDQGPLTHRQILAILSGLILGMFLAALDQTIVATAIRTIGDDLNGLSVQAWVTTAFLITSTITTPLYGKLSDIYGRKPLFLFAIAVFILGSALCGLSTSMYMLAAFRAFQGIGAGGLFTLALAIIADIVSPRERARYQGYFLAVFATSSVLGPVVGGFFAGQSSIFGITGWRWIFYINVPIGLIAVMVVNRTLHVRNTSRGHAIDWQGALALIVWLVPLLIVAEKGRDWGWGSPIALACYLIGACGLALLLWIESRQGDDALIPLRLFRTRNFAVGASVSFIAGVGMFGGIASIPLYLQIVKGASPTKAGLLILPLVLGLMFSSLLSGQVTSRTGRYRLFPIIGTAMMVVGLLLLHVISADTPLWQTDVYMLVFGLGLGLIMQTVVLAMQNAVPVSDIGVSTASATFFRQVGGTLGTAVFLSILFSGAPNRIKSAYQSASQDPAFQAAARAHPDQLKQVTGGSATINDTSFLSRIDSVLAHPFKVGFSQAMSMVFLVGACVVALGFLLSLLIVEVPLRTMSGMEAARAEAATEAAAASQPTSTAPPVPADADGGGGTRAPDPQPRAVS